MRHTGLEEAQAGIKIAGRNINNLRYADDTILMGESEEELKSLLMKVKVESEKASLKLNIKKLRSWHLIPSFGKCKEKKWKHIYPCISFLPRGFPSPPCFLLKILLFGELLKNVSVET